MKEEIANVRQREADDEKVDIQELLFKYIIHWPWFVGAVLVCLIGAWIYLRMATPVYNISATVIIKDDKKGGNTGSMAGLEELGLSGLTGSSQNIDNELEVLRSKTLVKEVVNLLNLYVSYTDEDEFPSKNMYNTSPVLVSLTPQEAEKLSDPMYVSLYQAFLKTQENYTFYTAPKLDSYLDLETKFEELIRQTLSVKRLEWQEHPEDMDKLVSETLEDFKAAYTQ